ncbi:MAG: OmpA family protein [Gammaproteobacteria bacterium]|nr:OmpA family protein [Gammaproteobacteria bacterium]MCP5423625.1 OmpA family protein [Gammaproteobacteria bacterium]
MNTGLRIAVCATILAITACAADNPYQRTAVGAGVGAVAGAVLGHQIDGKSGRYVGAAAGALVGGAIGNYMDRQQQAFDQALAEERGRYNMEIQRLEDGSIKLDIPSEVSFDFNKADIKPAFTPTLDKVANLLQEYNQTNIEIIGYTDSVGSESYNMELSRRRAESVAGYLSARGVAPQRLQTVGRGESDPRASNATEAGRQLNRRVEMVIRADQSQQQQGYQQPGPGNGAPQQGGYGAPQQGGYGAPQQGGYGAPQQGGNGAPDGGYSQQNPYAENPYAQPPSY